MMDVRRLKDYSIKHNALTGYYNDIALSMGFQRLSDKASRISFQVKTPPVTLEDLGESYEKASEEIKKNVEIHDLRLIEAVVRCNIKTGNGFVLNRIFTKLVEAEKYEEAEICSVLMRYDKEIFCLLQNVLDKSSTPMHINPGNKMQSGNTNLVNGDIPKDAELYFEKAIFSGMIDYTDGKYKWNGSKIELACFVDRLCKSIGFYAGKYKGRPCIPWSFFEKLFDVKGLKDIKKSYEIKNILKDYDSIQFIFRDTKSIKSTE